MTWRRWTAWAAFFLATLFAPTPAPASDPLAQATVVVYNSADVLSESLARYYAEKRDIPADHVVGLPCPVTEEITREQYDETLAGPLRRLFTDRGWWKLRGTPPASATENGIRFLALIRGIPLKISATSTPYPGDAPSGPEPIASRNEAAVDSELATLGLASTSISGAVRNPYFRSYTPVRDANIPPLMLVCRLDAPTGSEVRRMIDDSLAAEKAGVWGFAYIDMRNITEGGLAEGDTWLRGTAKQATESGIPVVADHGEKLFPPAYPMTHVAFYYGWYDYNVTGPFTRGDFRFERGAVAAHIHSFSASTLRDPRAGWAGPLVMAGAAATFGNVYEPYLGLTTQIDIFQERLQAGFTFAESAYMATNILSWMSTFIGDPLYRPFHIFQDFSTPLPKAAGEWLAYRNGALAWFKDSPQIGERRLREAAQTFQGGVIFEGLAALQAGSGKQTEALESSEQARRRYKDPADILRVVYREANLLTGMGRKSDGLDLLRRHIRQYPGHPAIAALEALRDELDPPPTPPPAEPAP